MQKAGWKMKKAIFGNYIFYVVLVVMATAMTILIMVLMSGEQTKNKIIIEHDAERAASLLVEDFFESKLESPSAIDPRIKAFGIYSPTGEKIYSWGRIPSSILLPNGDNPPRRDFTYSDNGKILTLIRPIGLPRMVRRLRRMYRPEQEPPPPPMLYIEFDVTGHSERSRSTMIALQLIPLFTAVSVFAIAFLYFRNTQYKKKLEQQSELEKLGEIARTLAHEIKNPLGAMKIQTAYLQRTLGEQAHEGLTILDEEISRLNLLTQRISDFVRDPIGSPEEIGLPGFIDETIKKYKESVLLSVEKGEAYMVLFDRERLRSIIENLVTNGLESYDDYGENDGQGFVEIRVLREKGKVVLVISDRGKGIPKAGQSKIFDPFYSTKTKGSGIGLAITKRFVEATGGTINLLPREGGGTCAKIVFRREEKS
jgi:two-component system sensor histidine kinase HydH